MKFFEALKQKRSPTYNRDGPKIEKALGDEDLDEAALGLSEKEQFKRLGSLTARERDLFLLLLEGYTLKESAKRMSIKYSTAKTHMTWIYKKLDLNTRAELIIRYRNIKKGAN